MHTYLKWIEDAESFVMRIKHAKCVSSTRFEKAPPMAKDDMRTLKNTVRLNLPYPIEEFLCGASAGVGAFYRLQPGTEAMRERYLADFGSFTLTGLVDLCVAEKLVGWLDTLEELASENELSGVDLARGMKLFPFASAGGGDLVALDTSVVGCDSPVVYVSYTGESPVSVMSASFGRFLDEWESLYYLDLYTCRYCLPDGFGSVSDASMERSKIMRDVIDDILS